MPIVLIAGSSGLVGFKSLNFFSEKGFDLVGVDKFKKLYPGWVQKNDSIKIINELIYS